MKLNYIVRPTIPIRGVFEKTIVREEQRKLEKEEVKTCIKYGAVFRKFDLENIVRVNLLNIDRLHNEKFISEEEWNKKKVIAEEVIPVAAPVVDEVVEEPTVAEVVEENEESAIEEVSEPEIAEAEVTEEVIEEVVEPEITMEEVTEEVAEAEVAEEDTVEEAEDLTEEAEEVPVVAAESFNGYNNQRKKKRR